MAFVHILVLVIANCQIHAKFYSAKYFYYNTYHISHSQMVLRLISISAPYLQSYTLWVGFYSMLYFEEACD